MDGVKLITKSEEEHQKQIQRVKRFSDYIRTEFGFEKCAKIPFKRSKLIYLQILVINNKREIQELEKGKTYKHLAD
jgi:hypothetical protein